MSVFAEMKNGVIVPLLAVSAEDFDTYPKGLFGVPWIYCEGSNPPRVYPLPLEGITLKIEEE